jgi:hypothetical protein
MTGTESVAEETLSSCSCKVGRNIDKYELRHLDTDLRRRRVDDGESLRDLATFVNAQILDRAMSDAGAAVAGDATAVYRALTGDDVGSGRQTEVRRRLANAGVQMDDVDRDFVSHQTVRDHLRTCLDVETSRNGTTDPDDAADLIGCVRDRNEQIIDRTLNRLHEADRLDTGPLDVTFSVRVSCERCGSTYRVDELLDRGGCEC